MGLGLDLIFDYNMVEIHLIMDEIYVEREEVMNELLAEFENEGNTEPLLNTTEVQQIWEIINLNAIESIKQSSQELVEDSSELNHPTSLGPELGNNESCPCGSGRPYKRCCFNLN